MDGRTVSDVVEAIQQIIQQPFGQCYAASEAAYHLLGGKAAGWKPMFIRLNECEEYKTHWWLQHEDGTILDITAGQFPYGVPYHRGIGCGFLTKHPSKRAQEIINAIKV